MRKKSRTTVEVKVSINVHACLLALCWLAVGLVKILH